MNIRRTPARVCPPSRSAPDRAQLGRKCRRHGRTATSRKRNVTGREPSQNSARCEGDSPVVCESAYIPSARRRPSRYGHGRIHNGERNGVADMGVRIRPAVARGSARGFRRGRLRSAFVIMATAATVVGLAPAASAAYGSNRSAPPGCRTAGFTRWRWPWPARLRRRLVHRRRRGAGRRHRPTPVAGNADGDVRALALGPNGTLLLGGAFTTVGGATHRKPRRRSTPPPAP